MYNLEFFGKMENRINQINTGRLKNYVKIKGKFISVFNF